MLENYRQELDLITKDMDLKVLSKYHVNALLSLAEKLQDKEDETIQSLMLEMKEALKNPSEMDRKKYSKDFVKLTSLVEERFGFKQKGSVQAMYTGIGIALGAGIGTALGSVISAGLAVGISIGLALGAGLGAQKEKEADKNNKLY